MALENRIVGEGQEDPTQLLANPFNFRRHPTEQLDALEGALEEIGWIQRVIVNQTTGHLIDGHARVELAIRREEKAVPVVYVALTESQEQIALATFYPIGALAYHDDETLKALLADIVVEDARLNAFLDTMAQADKGGMQASQAAQKTALTEQFIIPPFSVFDARQGYWQDRKRAWKEYGVDSGEGRAENLLSYSSVSTMGGKDTSIFDPVLTEVVYRWFAPPGGRILDPFAGGSVRGIVAATLGYRYTGIDIRPEQVEANRKQWAALDKTQDPPPEWKTGDSAKLAKLTKKTDRFDLLFSCPPYADLEQYSEDPADISTMEYPAFMEAYRGIIGQAAARLNENRFAVWVVGEIRDKAGHYRNLVGDTIAAFEAAGLRYYNEIILVTSVGSLPLRAGNMFRASRKVGKGHQNVLVFRKGEPEGTPLEKYGHWLAQHFEAHRATMEVHEKVLVFAKGNPSQAASEFGAVMTDDQIGEGGQ